MKKKRQHNCIMLTAVLTIMALATICWALPQIIKYQGSISDADGNPLNGDVEMEFYLFTDSQAGDTSSASWSESQMVHVVNGVYNIMLGSSNPLTKDTFQADELYLEVWVEGERLVPRQRITSVPYAIFAEDANSAGIAESVEVGAIKTEMLQDSSITSAKIVDGAISSSDIANGAITSALISPPLSLTGSGSSALLEASTPGTHGLLGNSSYGVYGQHYVSNSFGFLGGMNTGVYGFDDNLYGVKGSSTTGYGIYGETGSSSATAVYGVNTSGNYGSLGSGSYGVYGNSSSGYAGFFEGQTRITQDLIVEHRIGIGTTSPGTLLDIQNETGEAWVYLLRGDSQNGGLAFKEQGATDTQWIFPFFRGWQSDNLIVRDEVANIDVMTFQAGTGQVGIGLSNPSSKLDVAGRIRAQKIGALVVIGDGDKSVNSAICGDAIGTGIGDSWFSAYAGFFTARGKTDIGIYATASGINGTAVLGIASNDDTTGKNYGGYFTCAGGEDSVAVYAEAKGDGMAVWGKSSHRYGSSIYGTTDAYAGRAIHGEATGDYGYAGYFEGRGYFSGHVGIGITASPNASLKISGIDNDGNTATMVLISGEQTLLVDGNEIDTNGDLYLNHNGTGNVHVADGGGRLITPVLQITSGSDLSEQFDIDTSRLEPKPGMLVSIDPQKPGKLIVSNIPYDKKVAGVISGAGGIKPGMLMGQKDSEADGAYPIALTGRVYCYADASYGEIEPGDLLTTSKTPGYAMRVSDYSKAHGTIIGKAMQGLKKGEKGQILILVTLH